MRKSRLVEQHVEHVNARPELPDARDLVLAPALDQITLTPFPTAKLPVDNSVRTTPRSAPDHHQVLSNLITLGVERRVGWKLLGDLKDAQIVTRIVERFHDRVIDALVDEFIRDVAEVFGRDKKMRRDRSPKKLAELPLELPAAASERAGRRGRVRRRIGGPKQEHRARGSRKP